MNVMSKGQGHMVIKCVPMRVCRSYDCLGFWLLFTCTFDVTRLYLPVLCLWVKSKWLPFYRSTNVYSVSINRSITLLYCVKVAELVNYLPSMSHTTIAVS